MTDTPTPCPEVMELCPHCGGKAECSYNGPTEAQIAHAKSWGDDVDWSFYGECTHCFATGPACSSRSEAIAAWNRRSDPATAEVERPKRIDKKALSEAAKKLARLRVETVGGDKSRPAETVRSCLNRGFGDLGSQEGIEYILRHGIKYYDAASAALGEA